MNLKLSALLIVGVFTVAPTLANASYTFTTYGNLGGIYGAAYGINSSGQLAGHSGGHATLWSGSTVTDLGTLGGSSSIAWAINDAGQVAGISYTTSGNQHATLWTGGTMTDLGTLGGNRSFAYGINKSAQVVGMSEINTYSSQTRATIWNNATVSDLGSLAGSSWAYAINDMGVVTGWSEANGGQHATIWNGTTITDLGTLGSGVDINNSGQVAGFALTNGTSVRRATIWDGNTVSDLGTLGGESVARAINDSGMVVGWSRIGTSLTHGFLWDGTTMIDINTLLDADSVSAGWVLTDATDINDKGWIVGIASNGLTGQAHAFQLTPVPEPETYVMMLAGLGFMGWFTRKRRTTSDRVFRR